MTLGPRPLHHFSWVGYFWPGPGEGGKGGVGAQADAIRICQQFFINGEGWTVSCQKYDTETQSGLQFRQLNLESNVTTNELHMYPQSAHSGILKRMIDGNGFLHS